MDHTTMENVFFRGKKKKDERERGQKTEKRIETTMITSKKKTKKRDEKLGKDTHLKRTRF